MNKPIYNENSIGNCFGSCDKIEPVHLCDGIDWITREIKSINLFLKLIWCLESILKSNKAVFKKDLPKKKRFESIKYVELVEKKVEDTKQKHPLTPL